MNPYKRSYQWLWYIIVLLVAVVIVWTTGIKHNATPVASAAHPPAKPAAGWQPPDTGQLYRSPEAELIRYGKNLVASTAFYLGPHGTIAAISNGMNCQNCHLEAGTRFYGNNYSAVFSTYPKFRDRSGSMENIYKRVNDCMERSLNGKRLDSAGREMQAIYAYIKWLGQNTPKNNKPAGAGIRDIPFPARAADTGRGRLVYTAKCQRCHGGQGEGVLNKDSTVYAYPPLWGPHSYTTSAGLYRISRFAGYVRDNMPFGASYNAPQLTDEEAWDVAAFVNTQPRPQKIVKKDWPVLSTKPIDYPFGPYADSFSQQQHKYGPFEPIRLAKQQKRSIANK